MAERKPHKRKSLTGTLTLAGFLVIVGLAGGVLYRSTAELKDKELSYIEREEILTAEILEQETLKSTLEERRKYVSTDQYIEEIAREKLGLLAEDEVLLKESDN